MTPERQRVVIAEACGWVQQPHPTTGELTWIEPKGFYGMENPLPDYLNDLNACHAMEKVLSVQQRSKFKSLLVVLTFKSLKETMIEGRFYTLEDALIDAFFAIAAQRSEAFLRTICKWED